MKELLVILQNYYPEMLFKMYILNANWLFKALWIILKPFIDKKTRNKIVMAPNLQELLKDFTKEAMLKEYGGLLDETEDILNPPPIIGSKIKVENLPDENAKKNEPTGNGQEESDSKKINTSSVKNKTELDPQIIEESQNNHVIPLDTPCTRTVPDEDSSVWLPVPRILGLLTRKPF